MMSDVLLSAHGLQQNYQGKRVVDVDEFTIRQGEVVAVLGANGAGKSTLFRLLLGLERPVAGEVRLRGRAAGVFQRPYLFDGSVADNLEFGLHGAGVTKQSRRERITALAEVFGLRELLDVRVHSLSGGETQRVALVRALVIQPDVLLLDEPTANLDATVKRHFRDDLVRNVRSHARSVLIITHDAGDAFGVADRIVVMENGRIVQQGAPDELLANPETSFVASFSGAELLLNGTVKAVAEDLVHIALVDGGAVWAALPQGRPWNIERGARMHVAYRPEDVVLASPESSSELSARNQFRLRVESLGGTGGLIRLRLQGQPSLSALITRTSCESLGLRPGREVIAHLKAAALRAFPI